MAVEVYPFATEEHSLLIEPTQYVETIKRRHLFDRYSIVFHSFSVSEREKWGKHIEKQYDKERRNTGPGRLTEERWGQIYDIIGTLTEDGVIPHRIKSKLRAKRQKAK